MTPEFARFRETFDPAIQQGLVAAAAIYHGAIREKLQRGYTSGDFTQGVAANSVQMTPVEPTADGAQIVIGSNLDYTLYWELGHYNLFTRRFERVEYWQNTLDEKREEMEAAFGGEVAARLEFPEFIGPVGAPRYG